MAAGERKIFRLRLSAVLPGNDVIEMKWKLGEWFGEMTVFAAMLCPVTNGFFQSRVHERSSGVQGKTGFGFDEFQRATDVKIIIQFLGFGFR